jgi:lycopene beta-cyclase
MQSYDLIIAGGGAAGLSLVYHLLHSPLRDHRILIVEQAVKDQNDRTWCFWTDHPTPFDDIVSCSWRQLQILCKHFSKTLDLQRYRYHMIRGIDFYRFVHQAVAVSPHVDFLQGKVDGIEDGAQAGHVLVDGQSYTGTWIFDSLFAWSTFQPDHMRYHVLKQQFMGWEIETAHKTFNPQTATFLDFRTSQEQGTHFFYMLPFSEQHALVESVYCTTTPVSWEACKQAIDTHLANTLGFTTYRIKRQERGISPLTDWPFPRQRGKHIMTIGIKGGMVKPSTGYAFQRIQQDSAAIVRSLLQMGHPFNVPTSPHRYRFFDSVMLSIMSNHGEQVESILTTLFQHNSTDHVFRFLDEAASPWENALMVPSLPPRLLWEALLQIAAILRL